MAPMAKRLKARGHHVEVFNYPTRGNSLEGHARELHDFITKISTAELHLVGHSMGGLIVLNLVSRFDDLPPGRIVLMGTPVKGSSIAKRLENFPGQKFLFGKAMETLVQGFQYTPRLRETGMIRGTRPIGLGRITGPANEPNDGSVTVRETELEGLKDSVELDVTHSQMLVSGDVLDQVEHFLEQGRFS